MLALAEMRDSDDMIGAALVLEAWTRCVRLKTLTRWAVDHQKEDGVGATLDWLKGVIDSGAADLSNEAFVAARAWLERTVLDDLAEIAVD